MSIKILLIEDNVQISENITKYLWLEWIVVNSVYDWLSGLNEALSDKYDLILLDIMLPSIDWIDICKRIRDKIKTNIIILTARSSIDDKIIWLESWADDYIVKPFDMRELLARIYSLTRRTQNNNIINIDWIEVCFDKKLVLVNDSDVWLTLKEFLIFEYLLNNLWRAVSRTDIIEYVWWYDNIFEWDSKLDVYISNLRKKINKDVIKTIKGYWYIINKK